MMNASSWHRTLRCEARGCKTVFYLRGRHHCRQCSNSVCDSHFCRPLCTACSDASATEASCTAAAAEQRAAAAAEGQTAAAVDEQVAAIVSEQAVVAMGERVSAAREAWPAAASQERAAAAASADGKARMGKLLTILADSAATTPRAPLPDVLAERLPPGSRGVSLDALIGLCDWLQRHGNAHVRPMAFVIDGEGFAESVCSLTAHTGLSLVESLRMIAKREGVAHSDLFGPTDNFLSYSREGSTPAALCEAVENALAEQEAEGVPGPRFTWLDLLAVPHNLLGGRCGEPAVTEAVSAADASLAPQEEAIRLTVGALESASELLLFASPLLGAWDAPPHVMLGPDLWPPTAPWRRRGPYAVTRGWCLYELATGVQSGLKLRVVLDAADRAGFESTLVEDFDAIVGVLAEVDAAAAQLSSASERQLILAQIGAMPNSLNSVTHSAQSALKEWLSCAGKEALNRLPMEERGTSKLINQLGMLLEEQGDLEAAELLHRHALHARGEALGGMHPETLISARNLGMLLYALGDLGSAEPLLRQALQGQREARLDTHPTTLTLINNLGSLLQAGGDLEGAAPLLREALQARRATLGDLHPETLTCELGATRNETTPCSPAPPAPLPPCPPDPLLNCSPYTSSPREAFCRVCSPPMGDSGQQSGGASIRAWRLGGC